MTNFSSINHLENNMPSPIKRRFISAAIAVWTAALLPGLASAQTTWPRQPFKIIMPAPAGSAPDVMMRLIGEKLSTQLGKPVVIDNKVGAGGIVAVQALQNAQDNHTAIFMFTSVVLTPMLFKTAKFDATRDFEAIAGLAETTMMMIASPSAPAKTLPEIIKLAQEKPEKLVIGHSGPGSLSHLTAESVSQQSKARFQIVSFGNPGNALTALVNGDAQYYTDGVAAVMPFVKSGRVVPVGVFSSSTLPGLENYKLINETLPGTEIMGRFGLMATKDLPKDAIPILNTALAKALADPEVIAKLREFGTYPRYSGATAYAETIRKEQSQWTQVLKTAGIEPQ
jgi:tripartite-type tricarboxylate transporter receptor subunit TctC